MIPSRLRRQQAVSAAFGLEQLEDRVVLATGLNVTTLLDTNIDGDGELSLREAITAANDGSTIDGHAGSVGADTITFDAGLFADPGRQTIALGSALPQITDQLTIAGPGAKELAIVGDGTFALLENRARLELSGVTLDGGTVGLLGSASFDLTEVSIENVDVGIDQATLTASGGDLYRSAISATSIGIDQDGGSETRLYDSSVTAPTGIRVANSDGVDLYGSTVLGTTGPGIHGLTNGMTGFYLGLDAYNSIILSESDNAITMDGNGYLYVYDSVVGFVDEGANGGTYDPDAETKTAFSAGSEIVTTLADNGGPVPTFALTAFSQARGLADSSAPNFSATDARGVNRNTTPDAGAFQSTDFVVTTLDDEDDGTADPTQGTGTSLREAIDAANGQPAFAEATITFDFLLWNDFFAPGRQTIALDSTLPQINGALTVEGPGADQIELVASSGGTIFDGTSAGELSLSGLMFSGYERGIYTTGGSLDLQRLVFDGSAESRSYGVWATSGTTVAVADTTFTENFVALFAVDAGTTVAASNVTVADTATTGSRWGLELASDAELDARHVTIDMASDDAKGIFAPTGTTANVANSLVFTGSTQSVYAFGGTVNLVNSLVGTLDDNSGSGTINVGHRTQTGIAAADVIDTTLADNGGPVPTLALANGSAAIGLADGDLALAAGIFADARGFLRGPVFDAGSFQDTTATLFVTTLADEDDGTTDPSQGAGTSLREVFNVINGQSAGAPRVSVEFDAGLFTDPGRQTLALGGALPTLTNDILIVGPGTDELVIVTPQFDTGLRGEYSSLIVRDLALDGHGGGIGLAVTGGRLQAERVEAVGFANAVSAIAGAITSLSDFTGESFNDTAIFNGGNAFLRNTTLHHTGTFNAINIQGGADVTLSQSTLVSIGRGVINNDAGGFLSVENSIILTPNNTIGQHAISFSDGNVFVENSVVSGIPDFGASYSIDAETVVDAVRADTVAATLADNGGPVRTFALVRDSAALDSGDNALAGGLTTDAAGNPRIAFGTVDAGAVEAQTDLVSPTVALAPVTTVASTASDLTLSFTFSEAMDQSLVPTISFPSEDPTAALTLDSAASGWQSATEYRAVFTVAPAGLDLTDVDVRLTGAADLGRQRGRRAGRGRRLRPGQHVAHGDPRRGRAAGDR